MTTLESIGRTYGTDKVTHGYLPIYETFLDEVRPFAKKVLEIGIAGGASLRMWQDYFPQAVVVGVDHNKDYCKVVGERIRCVCGDATKPETWDRVRNSFQDGFDLLVDDGFHTTADIITAFGFAFPLVRSGGLYVIEDVGTSYDPLYQRDNHHVGGVKNAVEFFKTFVDDINTNADSPYESIHFHKSLVIIRKR